jgi:hypothetical protein
MTESSFLAHVMTIVKFEMVSWPNDGTTWKTK